jgi:hypothetical protein
VSVRARARVGLDVDVDVDVDGYVARGQSSSRHLLGAVGVSVYHP